MNASKRIFPAAAGAATKHVRTVTTGSLASGEQALNLPFKPEAVVKAANASRKARKGPPPSRVGLDLPKRPGASVRGGYAGMKSRRLPPPSRVGM